MQKIYLRVMNDEDKDDFLSLEKELSFEENIFENEEVADKFWKENQNLNKVSYSILTIPEEKFCGYCAVTSIEDECPEIEIEINRQYHRQGIGFRALCMMLMEIAEKYNKKSFYSRVDPDNYASQKLMEKIGGVPDGILADRKLLDTELEIFESQNLDLIDDKIEAVAQEFQVEPKSLLSHVLKYYITTEAVKKAISKERKKGTISKRCYIESERKIGRAKMNYGNCRILTNVHSILDKAEESNYNEILQEAMKYLQNEMRRLVDKGGSE